MNFFISSAASIFFLAPLFSLATVLLPEINPSQA
jgi:hypothetical protein